MKRSSLFLQLLLFVIAASVFFSSCSMSGSKDFSTSPLTAVSPMPGVDKLSDISPEIRGVWIASVHNINFPSAPDLSEDELKSELDAIVKTTLKNNLNTVYFQVHPTADALYKSELFPVSKFLYSDGVLEFDPLEYMIEICRKNGISLYAWVNPLRVSASTADSEDKARAALPKDSPAKDSKLTVYYGDGKLYFNCGVDAVRELVTDAVTEIASNYDVDGIVFDDYFYPYPVNDKNGVPYEFDDSDAYKSSGTELSLADWRRDNVNRMIKECYNAVKSENPDVVFGVAPFGIWQNDDGSNGGSATSGLEAYNAVYCDATAWIKGKYIDFISPQLYWRCDSAAASYIELSSFWNRITEGTGVDLIISHGIYQYETWENPKGELTRQIEISREQMSYKGSMLYGYAALAANTAGIADDTVEAFGEDIYYCNSGSFPAGIELSVNDGATVSGDTVIFEGYADPDKILLVNGISVTRSHGGYFKCELELLDGENKFNFNCGDASKTVTVIYNLN